MQLSRPAIRIVALAPHLSELVYAAGAGDRLVGVVRGSDYPAAVTGLPQVGDAAGLDVERILALRPDLILAWASGNRPSDVRRLESLGLTVFTSEPRRVGDVATTLARIGTLAGTPATARRAADDYQVGLRRLAQPSAVPVPVFIEIWDRPLMTVNGEHLISDAVATCGGSNVFAGLPSLAPSVSLEAVLAADPALILVAVAPSQDALAGWRRFPRLQAVATGRVYAIDPDLVARATPRLLLGIEKVCGLLRDVGSARRER